MTYWKSNSLQLFNAQSMQMLMWSCGIALFYLLFNMSSLFPLYFSVYMSMSASLYHCHLSLHLFGSHCECISLCCFLLFFHLTLTSFPSLWISLTCSLYLGFFFQFSFNLEKDTLFYTVLYQTNTVNTVNSEISCISNCSLVKEDKSPPSTSFLEVLWEGMSEMATAMLMAVIVKTSYLSSTL